MQRLVPLAVLLLATAACGGGGGGRAPRPPIQATGGPGVDLDGIDQPDVLVMTFSGHDGASVSLDSDTNRAYLADAGSIGPRLRAFLAGHGASVVERHFADRLVAPDMNGDGRPDRLDGIGFLEALSVLDHAATAWIEDHAEPTAVVVVGHSHGATWAHLLTEAAHGRIGGALSIRVLVTLDGVQTLWDDEHEADLIAWWDALPDRTAHGFRFDRDPSASSDAILADAGYRNVKDVVWPNVRWAYEIMSDDSLGLVLRDLVRNVPLAQGDLVPAGDASGTTIWTRDTRAHGIIVNGVPVDPPPGDPVSSESHGGVHAATSPSVEWLLDRLVEHLP